MSEEVKEGPFDITKMGDVIMGEIVVGAKRNIDCDWWDTREPEVKWTQILLKDLEKPIQKIILENAKRDAEVAELRDKLKEAMELLTAIYEVKI
jgi:hypothetical protein